MQVMPALFEVVTSGENAFHHFYTIDFTNAPEIQSILGFESSILEKGIDNPKRYFMNTNWNQIVVSNGTMALSAMCYRFPQVITLILNSLKLEA